MGSQRRTCPNPEICGVRYHLPGTVCKSGTRSDDRREVHPSLRASSVPSTRSGGEPEIDDETAKEIADQISEDNLSDASGDLFQDHPNRRRISGSDPKSYSSPEWHVNIHRVEIDGEACFAVVSKDPTDRELYVPSVYRRHMALAYTMSDARAKQQAAVERWNQNWENRGL